MVWNDFGKSLMALCVGGCPREYVCLSGNMWIFKDSHHISIHRCGIIFEQS